MKIAVVGATGALGTRFVEAALNAGHDVVAFVRHPEAMTSRQGLEIRGGELTDAAGMVSAFTGADVVVSLLGWKRDRRAQKPLTFMQQTVPPLRQAVADAGVPLFVLTSAFGVGDTRAKASGIARLAYRIVVGPLFDDKARAEAAIQSNGPRTTIVYPVNLKDAPSSGGVTVEPLDRVASVPGLPALPYVDAAQGVLLAAPRDDLAGRQVLVTTTSGWRPTR